ncbi:hypothetical protein [Pedobacter steynii]
MELLFAYGKLLPVNDTSLICGKALRVDLTWPKNVASVSLSFVFNGLL